MPDENQKLGIDINVTKSGAGGAEAADEINKATGATGKFTDAQNEEIKTTEKSNVNRREFLRLMGLGGDASREFGHLLLGLGEGPLGSMLALGLAIKLIADYFGDLKKQGEEASKSFDGFDDIQKIMRDSAQSAAEFATNLAQVATSQKQIADSVAREREERQIIAKLKGEVSAAHDAEAEAKINADLAAGLITPQQAALKKGQLQYAAKQRAQDEANATAQGKSSDLATQFDAALKDKEAAADRVKTAQAAHEQSLRERKAAEHTLKLLDDQMPALLEASNKADEQAKDLREKIANPATMGDDRMLFQQMLAGLENQNASGAYGAALASRQKLTALLSTPDTTSKELSNAQENLKGIMDALRDLPPKMRAAFEESRATTRAADSILGSEAGKIVTDLIAGNRGVNIGAKNAPFTVGQFADAQAAERAREHRDKLSKAQQEAIATYENYMKNILDYHTLNHQILTQMMVKLDDAMLQLKDFQILFGSH